MILINGSCAQRRAGVQGHDASSLFCSANTEHGAGSAGTTERGAGDNPTCRFSGPPAQGCPDLADTR